MSEEAVLKADKDCESPLSAAAALLSDDPATDMR